MLVYSVCSLEPEEGEQVIERFLRGNPHWALDPVDLADFATTSGDGWFRTLPGTLEAEGGLDGFFIARLVRSA